MESSPVIGRAKEPGSQGADEDSRAVASGRAGLFALFLLCLVWRAYSLVSGNFRIQEAWSPWQYAQAFPQDLFLIACLYASWRLWLRKGGARALALTVAVCCLVLIFQCVDARMKVRFLHPLSWAWLKYAIAEARTIGPDYTVFTGSSYWIAALASLGVLLGAFLSPWVPFARAIARALGSLERLLRIPLLGKLALVPLGILAFLSPAQPYGLHRNFVLATLLPIDRAVVGYDQHQTRPSEQPVARSTAASFAHRRDSKPALCAGRNVVLYVIESLAREQTSFGSNAENSTPVLAGLLSQGAVETPCYAQFANSSKATFGLLSGVYAAQTMEVLECEMKAMSGLPSALEDAGYSSVCVTPQHLYYQGQRTMFQHLGFGELVAFLDLQAISASQGIAFDEVGPRSRDDRLMFLWDHGRLVERQPFAATYYTMSSHYPYQFPGQVKGSEEERHGRAVRYTDTVFGELLEEYRRRGLYDNTLFVITADHGEDFKAGRFAPRHSSLTENAHEVPLLFFAPGVDMSMLRLGRARQVDVLPTILDLLGLAPQGLPLSGESLLLGERERTVFLQSYGTERTAALIDGHSKWIWESESDARWAVELDTDPRGLAPRRIDDKSEPAAKAAADSAVRRMREFAIYNEAFLRDLVAGRVALPPREATKRDG